MENSGFLYVGVRFKPDEKRMLDELVTVLQRNQSDVIRRLVVGAVQVMREQEQQATQVQAEGKSS